MSYQKAFPYRRHSIVNLILILIAVVIITSLLITGCKKEQKASLQQTPRVSIITIAPRNTPVSMEFVAQTQSSHQVEIRSRVNGFLNRRVYTEGAIVKVGEVLFEMDAKPFKVQVDQAKAALDRQNAALEISRANLARVKPLAAANALSQKDLDDASGRFQSDSASVEQAKAQLESAKLNLSYCTISSPINGITSASLQQDGTYISSQNSHLTTVMVLSPIWVNFSLSENEMQKFRDNIAKGVLIPPPNKNYEIEIILVDGSIFPHTGRITFADPMYNSDTGTFLIRSSVENPKGILRPNQYVRVRVKGAIRPSAILVPQQSVQLGAKGHFVWVVNPDDTVQQRPVEVGEWYGNNWFINTGLKDGERVVVEGGLSLRPELKVKTQPYAEKTVSASGGGVSAAHYPEVKSSPAPKH